jgi:uncharacterized protein (DUF1501 family)
MKRLTFLQYTALAAAPLLVPSALVPLYAQGICTSQRHKLVLLHLQGGNDGFNTIVPYANENYYSSRPTIAIPANQVIKLDPYFGFNPALKSLKSHFDKGNMLILNNVSSPFLDHSHYSSSRVWEAEFARNIEMLPEKINLTHDELGAALKTIAAQIKSGPDRQVHHIGIDGFDTHQFQKHKHDLLLKHYAEATNCFLNELESSGQLQHTLVITWSEFGRQLKENTKRGTEHGNVNSILIYGVGLKTKGVWNNNYDQFIDVRNIYSTII